MANSKDVKRGIVLYLDGKEVKNNATSIQAEMRKLKKDIDACAIGSDEYVNKTKRYRELNSMLSEHRKALGKVADATSQASKMGESYANQITSMLGLNSKFGSSLMSLSSGGGVFKNLGAAVSSFGSTLAGLLANPAFLSIAGLAGVGAAFKFWYDYNKGISEATRLTREFLGVSGDGLVSVRSEIQALADAWGKDYKAVLQATDSLMSQYGIDAASALSVVKDGFVAGADANGTFLQQLQKYGPTFHDIGIDAQQLAALISQTRSGIFSEQGMDSIAMAGKRLREMSKSTEDALKTLSLAPDEIQKSLQDGSMTTFDVIQQVSEKMKSLDPQSREVGEVLKEVFGRQGSAAGYQLVTSFADVSTSIEEVKQQTGEYGVAMEDYTQAQAELNATTAALFDFTQQGFEEMGIQLKTISTRYLTEIIKGLIDLANWFIKIYNQSTILRVEVALLKNWFVQLGMGVKNVFNSLYRSFKAAGLAIDILISSMSSLFDLDFEKAASTLKNGLKDVGQNMVDGWKDLASTTADGINTMIGNIKNSVTDHIDPITIPVVVDSAYSGGGSVARGGSSIASGGSATTNGKGSTTSNGKGSTTSKSGKMPTEADRIKAETAVINTEILKRQAAVKQSYIRGEIDKREYNKQMENLELERIHKMLQIAGLEPQKIEELNQKILDIQLKTREQLDEQGGIFNDDSDEAKFNEAVENLRVKLADRQAVIDRAHELGLLSEEEYDRQMSDLQSQFNSEYERLVEDFIDSTDLFAKAGISLEQLASDIGSSVGEALASSITGNMDSVHDAFKSILLVIVDAIEKMVLAATVSNTLLTLTGFGTSAGIANLAKLVAVKALFAAIKTGINSFETGGFTGAGAHNSPAGIVHKGEFVATAQAVNNPAVKSILDVIDNAQQAGTVASLTQADLQSVSGNNIGSSTSSNDMAALISACTATMARVKERFDAPIVAETYATGRGGVNEAQSLVNKMIKNVSR